MGGRLWCVVGTCLLGSPFAGVHARHPGTGRVLLPALCAAVKHDGLRGLTQLGTPGQTTPSKIEVVTPYAKVRSAPLKEAPFLMLLKQGERYPLLSKRGEWYRVAVRDTTGWIWRGEAKLLGLASAPERAAQRRATETTERTEKQPKPASRPAPERETTPAAPSTPATSPPPTAPVTTKKPRREPTPPTGQKSSRSSPPSRLTPRPPRTTTTRPSPTRPRRPEPTPPPAASRSVRSRRSPELSTARTEPDREKPSGKTLPDGPAETVETRVGAAPRRHSDERRYAQALTGPLRVLAEVSPESPILGLITKGSNHPIIALGDSWVKIQYEDTSGWIERRYIEVTEKPSIAVIVREFLMVLSVIAAFAVVLLIIKIIASRRDRVRSAWVKTVSVQKNLLVVARDEKFVQRYLADTSTTLEKCFSEVGFNVTKARNGNEVTKLLVHHRPDVIAVDWDIDSNIHSWLARVLSSRASTTNVFTLFYNVPEPSSAKASGAIHNAQYLGPAFTDRDIFAVVTPQVITGERPAEIRKSVETSALEGDVGQGSLAEVFQFVEIGHKTGCLLVERQKPFGIIYFRQGAIVYAATTKATAEKAVFEMLDLPDGRFRFVLDREPRTTNCMVPTLGVLMEWTRLADEAARR